MDAATNIDVEVLALQPSPSDVEIVAELLEIEDASNDNNNAIKTEDEPVFFPDQKKLPLSEPCGNSLWFQKMVQLSILS